MTARGSRPLVRSRPGAAEIDNTAVASIAVIVGATGSGKSAAVRCALRDAPPTRLLIFDPGEDYVDLGAVFRDHKKLCAAAIAAGRGPLRAVFVPDLDRARERSQFNWFCHIAFLAGDVTVIADELEDVVLPSWAPAGWNLLVRKGRKRGVRVVALSQRPAGLEKRVWSFATVVRAGVLDDAADAITVAGRLRVLPHDIMALPLLHWVQWTREGRRIGRGHIEWRAGQPYDLLDSEEFFEPGAPQDGTHGRVPIG